MTTEQFNKEMRATSGWGVYEKWLKIHPELRCDNLPFEFQEGVIRRFILEKGFSEISTRINFEDTIGYYGNALLKGIKWIETKDFKTDQEASMSIILECFKTIS